MPLTYTKNAILKYLKGGEKMANVKPIDLNNSHISKEERKARKEAEDRLKGNSKISNKPSDTLSSIGKEIYKNIIQIMPNGFLTGIDAYIVEVVAEALARMKECQEIINESGLFIEGDENNAVKTYEKYSKIFNSYSSKLGMSPKDRAALSCLILQDQDKKEDPLLKILGDEE